MGLAATTLILPDPAPTLAAAAMAGLPASGLGNPVTGVLFVYRALDTLLEKVVLVLALVGVWSLAPIRRGAALRKFRSTRQPDGILIFLAQLLPPVGIMLGDLHVLGRRRSPGRRLPGRCAVWPPCGCW